MSWWRKLVGWLRRLFRREPSRPSIIDARIELPKAKPRESPHLGSWTLYIQHLFALHREGHGGSPAAFQTRDRLAVHWRFLSAAERGIATRRYQEAKIDSARIMDRRAHGEEWLALKREIEQVMAGSQEVEGA